MSSLKSKSESKNKRKMTYEGKYTLKELNTKLKEKVIKLTNRNKHLKYQLKKASRLFGPA